jgi:formamidopyrimidine-DNA glycosylase
MPELPEVQTIVDGLLSAVKGQKILNVEVLEPKTLLRKSALLIENQSIKNISRIGKYIIFEFQDLYLVVHLRMTGQFFFYPKNALELSPYDRVKFHLPSGVLVFRDVRKFGTMKVGSDLKDLMPSLGKDALDPLFDDKELFNLCQKSQRCIKAFLLDQANVAGLGNIYVDEALYESHIHPNSRCLAIPKEAVYRLYQAIIRVLNKALNAKGTSIGKGLGNYKHVNGEGKHQQDLCIYGKKGHVCQKCHSAFEKTVIASRGSMFCPGCQKLYI